MSLRQNIAEAVRQSSLAKSSRMGELLNRFERGMPCGTPDDIDFLIDEIVKRIEERLLCRLAQLPEPTTSQTSDKEAKQVGAWQLPARPRRIVSESTLRHEARLLVDQVLKIVKRHLQGHKVWISDGWKSKQQARIIEPPTERRGTESRDEDIGVSPQSVRWYNYTVLGRQAEPSRATKAIQSREQRMEADIKKTPAREPQAYQRLAYGDGESVRTVTTYALRKAAKTSLRRYSVTGNIQALMVAGEWAKSDDMRVITEPKREVLLTPLQENVKTLLADSRIDSPEERQQRQILCEEAPVEYPYSLSTPLQESPKARGASQFLNSSYTYARRADIKKALPKFLVSRSRDAMMIMFDAIRVAMAEEEVEKLDYAGLLAALIDRSREKDSPKPAKAPKTVANRSHAVEPGMSSDIKGDMKPGDDRITGSRGNQIWGKHTGGVSRDRARLDTRQRNFGTLGTYTLRKATRSCLRHMVQKGSSYNALLMMACNITGGQSCEKFWEDALDMELDETTKKEVISDLVELSRQARNEMVSQKWYSDEPRRTFDDAPEENGFESEKAGFKEESSRSGIISPKPARRGPDKHISEYKDGVQRPSITNYTYGMHRSLRRLLPKFTGRRSYAALMHHADSMMADVYQEMIRTGQWTPMITSVNASANVSARVSANLKSKDEPRQRDATVTRKEARYSKPAPAVDERRSESSDTGKLVAKTSSEELFHDAYSWIAQENTDQSDASSDETRRKTPGPSTKREDSNRNEMQYRPVGAGEFISAPAFLRENAMPETNKEPTDDERTAEALWVSLDEHGADASKRSVKFADGINPGEAGYDEEDHASAFFRKLGYYERVGSGELLHKKPRKPRKKAESADGADDTLENLEPEGGSSLERQLERSEEGSEGEPPQNTELMTKPPTLCNCL